MIRTAIVTSIAAITSGILAVLLTLAAAINQMPAIAKSEAAATREMLQAEIAAARVDVREQVALLRLEVAHRAASVERMVDAHALRIEDGVFVEIAHTRRALLNETRPVVDGATSLLETYESIPGAVGKRIGPWVNCTGNGACWQAQATGALGATRATLGAIARSAPAITESIERSAEASERATNATAKAMRNLEELSRPLPRWLRVPLQILGPTAPLYLPFVAR